LTAIPRRFEEIAVPGAFISAKIISVGDGEYIFSGIQNFLDGPEKEILKNAASLQREHPEFAFRDNGERIRRGIGGYWMRASRSRLRSMMTSCV
jgi:hypothetical protein